MQTIKIPSTALSEVRELNRLFLSFLRGRLADRAQAMGLPSHAAAVLSRSSDELVNDLSAFPQAMFKLNVNAFPEHMIMDPSARTDPAQSELQLTLLVSARSLCTTSPYAARLYLRLSAEDAQLLKALPLSDLPVLSRRHDLVRCAYAQIKWMWSELLRLEQPANARVLILLGLQPRIEINPPLNLTR